MTTRRSFLRSQLVLTGSFFFASGFDSLARAAKQVNILDGNGTLNFLCGSELGQLGHLQRTLKNFEQKSVNLFAGNLSPAVKDKNLFGKLSSSNYHAINFSLSEMHDLDAGISQMLKGAAANFVNCNYLIDDPALRKLVLPYLIIYVGKTKVGITGIGANTKSHGIQNVNSVAALNKVAGHLKLNQQCEQVICLADLGFDKTLPLNNLTLARQSRYVDVIVGAGKNLKNVSAWSFRNAVGDEVLVSANRAGERCTSLLQLGNNTFNPQRFNTKNI